MQIMVYYNYEELFVRAKKTQVVLHNDLRVNFAFTYDDLFQQYGCISSIELRNS